MFHLAAYAATIGNTAGTDVAAAVDDILTIQNNHFVLSENRMLVAAAAMSATLQRVQIASPSMRQVVSPYVRPINVSATPGNNPNVWLLDHSPFNIQWGEEIQVLATSGVAMTEPFAAFVWLQRDEQPMPRGNIIPWRWTSSTAAVANTWTSVTATFADTLPSGWYGIVHSECQSTNARAHRWIISNQMDRPGMLSYTALSQRSPYAMSMGQFGLWGRFRSNDLPRPQVFVNGTDASHEGYLHVVRLGPLT